MNECLMCGRRIGQKVTWDWLLSFASIDRSCVCDKCMGRFRRIDPGTACPGCGRSMPGRRLCDDCVRWKNSGCSLICNRALYEYDVNMKEYITRYKFMGDYRYRLVFSNLMRQFVSAAAGEGRVVVAVPVDQETFDRTRGFNQVEGWLEGMQFAEWLEMRQRKGRLKQSHKNRAMRMQTKQPFLYTGPESLDGQRILLVDDIYTTGRTLYHAKALFEAAGAESVISVTLAR